MSHCEVSTVEGMPHQWSVWNLFATSNNINDIISMALVSLCFISQGGHPFHKGPASHRHRRVSAWHSKGTAKGTVSLSVAVEVSTLQRTWTSADWYHRPVLEKDLWWSVEISRHGLTGGDSSAVLCKLKNEGHWNEMQRSILFCSSSWFYLTKIWLGPNTETLQQSAMACKAESRLKLCQASILQFRPGLLEYIHNQRLWQLIYSDPFGLLFKAQSAMLREMYPNVAMGGTIVMWWYNMI